MGKEYSRNKFTFGLGTIGRDMVYTMISMFMMFYLTDVLQVSNTMLAWLTGIILFCRVFDAVNDPIMGAIVDNTKTKWGKFKPWIAFGAVTSGIFTVLLFTDFGFENANFIICFGLTYVFWEITFTTNDISYWSMMPNLSTDQKEREKIGAIARICANVGLFVVVAGIDPITKAIGAAMGGDMKKGYFIFAVIVVLMMWLGQCVTLFGVKEPQIFKNEEHTSLKGMMTAIFKNDQLLVTAVSMSLFMIGYCTTTSFGLHFFKYAYGDEGMYSIFAVVLGVSQIAALAVFPIFSRLFSRRKLYTAATLLVVLGYVIFFFSPYNMLYIGAAGVLIFVGQAFIQLLMLMFLTDTIEYGQWKLHKRNDAVSFALQPFINKLGGAVASGIVGVTLIISGINDAASKADVTPEGQLILKTSMLLLPIIFIVAGFAVYWFKFKIDEKMYAKIISELKERGEIRAD
ncbi:MAG: glycoside-pentoside-hexuronide (GPH):cation symporter [Oscillospiraceae bacterium]